MKSGRREFLRMVAAALAGAAAAGCAPAAGEALRRDPAARRAAARAAALVDRDAAARIGERFAGEIGEAPALRGVIGLLDAPGDAGARLDAEVRGDFRNGRIHDLDGWTLSRTELDLCLLIYLLA